MAAPEACLSVQIPGCPPYLRRKANQRFRHVRSKESCWLDVLFEAKYVTGRNEPCVGLTKFINQACRLCYAVLKKFCKCVNFLGDWMKKCYFTTLSHILLRFKHFRLITSGLGHSRVCLFWQIKYDQAWNADQIYTAFANWISPLHCYEELKLLFWLQAGHIQE